MVRLRLGRRRPHTQKSIHYKCCKLCTHEKLRLFFSQTVYSWGSLLGKKELATVFGRALKPCVRVLSSCCPLLVLLLFFGHAGKPCVLLLFPKQFTLSSSSPGFVCSVGRVCPAWPGRTSGPFTTALSGPCPLLGPAAFSYPSPCPVAMNATVMRCFKFKIILMTSLRFSHVTRA